MSAANDIIVHLKERALFKRMTPDLLELWERLAKDYSGKLDRGPALKETAFTLHDFTHHCFDIYRLLEDMLRVVEKDKSLFENEEVFILVVAVLFHDISMAEENFNRKRHAEKSAEYFHDQHTGGNTIGAIKELRDDAAEAIEYAIRAHSDTKLDDGTKIRHLEADDSDIRGSYQDQIKIKVIAALLRLADAADITRDRRGGQMPSLDKKDDNQAESERHWERLKYISRVSFADATLDGATKKCILLSTSEETAPQSEEDREIIQNELIEIGAYLKKELDYVNKVALEPAGVLVATEVIYREIKNFNKNEINQKLKDRCEELRRIEEERASGVKLEDGESKADIKATDVQDCQKQEVGAKKKAQRDEATLTGAGSLPYHAQECVIIKKPLSQRVSDYIFDNNLLESGHYRLNRFICGTDWIDVRRILCDWSIGNDIIDAIVSDILDNDLLKPDCIIVGNGMNGNIMASRVAFRLGMPFTYVLSDRMGKQGSETEQKTSLKSYKRVIIMTGVVSTLETITNILDSYKIKSKVKYVYTVLYRRIIRDPFDKPDSARGFEIRAINDTFNAGIISKSICTLIRHDRCIARNLVAFNEVFDENGRLKDALRLIYGTDERIFINFDIGCTFGCKYCYMNSIGKQGKPDGRVYSTLDVVEYVTNMREYKPGKGGTILSFGCYTECLSEEYRETTLKTIRALSRYGNPIQISTKLLLDEKELQEVNDELLYEGQLTVNISMPVVSDVQQWEPKVPSPQDRRKNFRLVKQKKLSKIQFVLYVKPVIEHCTVQDIETYRKIIEEYKVPCVVGDYFVKTRERNIRNRYQVGEGYLEVKPSDEVEQIIEELRKSGEVYRHSTDLIKRMRRNCEYKDGNEK